MSTTARPDGPPDVQFRADYGRAASTAEHGELLDLQAHDGAWRMPVIVRTLADGGRDAITPTFSGVHAAARLSPEQVADAWATAVQELRDRGVVSLVVRGSPLVPQATALPGLQLVSGGRPSIVLDLDDEESAWSGLRSSCRSRVRKARSHGYTATVRPASADDLVGGGDFRRLYDEAMSRIAADPVYHLSDDYYAELFGGLGEDLLVAEVRDADGVVVSACLLMRHDRRLHYHLAGSVPDDAGMGSNNLMIWTAIQHAVEEGAIELHLGAGVVGRDGVLRFKSTFGGRVATYDVSGLVVDEDAYRSRVRAVAAERGVTAEELEGSGYFPAYRGSA